MNDGESLQADHRGFTWRDSSRLVFLLITAAVIGGAAISSALLTGMLFERYVTQRLILGVAAALGLVLCLALALLARLSSQAEQSAIKRLERQNHELLLIQRFTHSLLAPVDPGQLALDMVGNIASGLDLARAVLCRVREGDELAVLAERKVDDSDDRAILDSSAAVEAAHTRCPVVRGATVAVPLSASLDAPAALAGSSRQPDEYLLVAEFKQAPAEVPPLLDIMFHEAAIALARAGLFSRISETHGQLNAIVDGIADSMVMLDRDMRLVWMNDVAKAIYGERGDLFGCLRSGAPDEDQSCEGCPAVRTFRSGKVERGMRTEHPAGGGVRHVDLMTAPLFDNSGSVRHVLEVARDITESVESERQLKHSAARLEESHAALSAKTRELEAVNLSLRENQAQFVDKERLAAAGEVVVGLHHSVLNPLAGILGALQVLNEGATTLDERSEAFHQAQVEIHRIEQVVRGLSALRKVSAVPYVGNSSMLDLERSCHEAQTD